MYYIRFKTSLLIDNQFLSLLINDVTQLFLLRLAKKLMLKNLFSI